MGSPYLYRVEAYTKTGISKGTTDTAGGDAVAQGAGVFKLYEDLGRDETGNSLGYDGTHMHHWLFCRTANADKASDSDGDATDGVVILEGSIDKSAWYHLQTSDIDTTERTVLQTDARALSGMTYPYVRARVADTATRIVFDVFSFRNVDIRRSDKIMP